MSSQESSYLAVIRVWAAMAWADGVIAAAERAALERLIAGADLSDDERREAAGWLDQPVELDTAAIGGLSDEARRGIYRSAVRLARVDLEVASAELRFLERLREGLGLDEQVAEAIEAGP